MSTPETSPVSYRRVVRALRTQAEHRRALIAAVCVIRAWHRMPGPGKAFQATMQDAWAIYWRHAPEMAPIREALPGVNLDEPDRLLKEGV